MDSSSSTPSPASAGKDAAAANKAGSTTPLSTITNFPKRTLLAAAKPKSALMKEPAAGSAEDMLSDDKENVPFSSASPGKRKLPSQSSSENHRSVGGALSPRKAIKRNLLDLNSPRRSQSFGGGGAAMRARHKRSIMSAFDESDSSAGSKRTAVGEAKKPRLDQPEAAAPAPPTAPSMDGILRNCSPDNNEEGIAPLAASPDRSSSLDDDDTSAAKSGSDGFDVSNFLSTIAEEEASDVDSPGPAISITGLLSKKILDDKRSVPERPDQSSFLRKPSFRRTVSMMENVSTSFAAAQQLDGGSPVSSRRSNGGAAGMFDFKRPELPPSKKPKGSSTSSSSAGAAGKQPPLPAPSFAAAPAAGSESGSSGAAAASSKESAPAPRPKFSRSQSNVELTVKEMCDLKEKVANILPDSSRYIYGNFRRWVHRRPNHP